MRTSFVAAALLAAIAIAATAHADESGGYVIRLGRDTTGIERFTRAPGRLEVRQVGRSPRVLERHFVYALDHGAVTRLEVTVTNPLDPAGAPPMQRISATFTADSMRMEITRGADVLTRRIAMPRGTVLLPGSSTWDTYEDLVKDLVAGKADRLHRPGYYLGGDSLTWVTVRRLGRDSVEIENEYDLYHAQVDREGRLLHLVPIRGTAQFSVDRVATADIPAATARFLARQQETGAMGALSTRDTVRASAGGAALWIDYGRPARRGRVIFGGVVPWGDVWRTGANAATQFRTDRALEMGGSVVPAGTYTLWTVPSPHGSRLLVNSQTGQWGTEHHADRDLFTVDMQVSDLPQPVERFTIGIEPTADGGILHFDWDTRRASVPFKTKP